jgi:anti-anti-sigma regulatory factor
MLKITVTDETAALRVTVEGELTGPQADVLEANWRNAVLLRKEKNVVVDLCGVTSIDAAGKEVLRHMINSGAELSAFGPKTAYIIECLRNAKERGRA